MQYYNKKSEVYIVMDSYKKLSQDEIDLLYQEENITEKSYQQQLKELKQELIALGIDDEKDLERREKEQRVEELQKKVSTISEKLLLSTTKRKSKTRNYPSRKLRNQVFMGTIDVAKYHARVYFLKQKVYKFSYDDLFQIACEALLSACYYYVPNNGAKFRIYAAKCINNKLKKELYPKKKRRKSISIMEEFDYLHLLKKFLNGEFSSTSLKNYVDTRETSILLNHLNQIILDFNREVYNMGEDRRMLARVNRKQDRQRAEEKLEEILNMYINKLRLGAINQLITNEDREIISLISQRKDIRKCDVSAWMLMQYLNLYMIKLYQIDAYFELEQKLLEENDYIIPDDITLLKQLNQCVSNSNKSSRERVFLQKRVNFLTEYYNLFEVDLSNQEEKKSYEEEVAIDYPSAWECFYNDDCDIEYFKMNGVLFGENYADLELEKADVLDLLNEFVVGRNVLINSFFEKSRNQELRVLLGKGLQLSFSRIDYIEVICGFAIGDYKDGYTLDEALTIYDLQIEEIKQFTDKYNENGAAIDELQKRKNKVIESMNRKNKEIFCKNRALGKQVLVKHIMEDTGVKRFKRWKLSDLQQVRESIDILYCTDETLMGLIKTDKSSRVVTQMSVEEQVIEDLFIEDYNMALEELSSLQRQIWKLWYGDVGIHQMSAKEIANQLGISVARVYKEKEKGKTLLKKNFVLRGYLDHCI